MFALPLCLTLCVKQSKVKKSIFISYLIKHLEVKMFYLYLFKSLFFLFQYRTGTGFISAFLSPGSRSWCRRSHIMQIRIRKTNGKLFNCTFFKRFQWVICEYCRAHLVEVEEGYTQELMTCDDREQELRKRVARLEDQVRLNLYWLRYVWSFKNI